MANNHFYLFENIFISPSFVEHTFSGFRIFVWQLFYIITWKILFRVSSHWLLGFIIFMKSAVKLIVVFLKLICLFYLAIFKILVHVYVWFFGVFNLLVSIFHQLWTILIVSSNIAFAIHSVFSLRLWLEYVRLSHFIPHLTLNHYFI